MFGSRLRLWLCVPPCSHCATGGAVGLGDSAEEEEVPRGHRDLLTFLHIPTAQVPPCGVCLWGFCLYSQRHAAEGLWPTLMLEPRLLVPRNQGLLSRMEALATAHLLCAAALGPPSGLSMRTSQLRPLWTEATYCPD